MSDEQRIIGMHKLPLHSHSYSACCSISAVSEHRGSLPAVLDAEATSSLPGPQIPNSCSMHAFT
jgi:hypothetical protein